MFEEAIKILEKNRRLSEELPPLQQRINNALYHSYQQAAEEEPLKNIRNMVICGEKSLDIHPQEPWPQPISLYQPYEVEQILLPDNANCLAVQAYLKMCNLDFQIEPRWNAEYMSPSGKVPFIKCGAFVIPDFDNIVTFISNKGSYLSEDLSQEDKINLRAYMSLVNNVLYNAELYVCWCHDETYKNITKERHGSVYPWPLNHLLNWQKKNQVTKRLSILSWANRSLEEVFDEVKKCCEALSERLENKQYFFGDSPNQLDAFVFAHVHTLTTSNYPPPLQDIATIIRRFPLLLEHAYLIKKTYFHCTPNLGDSFEVLQFSSEESIINTLEPFGSHSSIFTNELPNELDALVFGHIFSIITTPLTKDNTLANIVSSYPTLIELCRNIEKRYFRREEE